MKTKIYIASPYTNGDKLQLVRLQIDAWHVLQDLGYYAVPPLLSHYINEVRERDWSEWLEYDFQTISMCDAVIRLRPKDQNGVEIPSAGADKEREEAKRLGLIYLEYDSVEEMKESLRRIPI